MLVSLVLVARCATGTAQDPDAQAVGRRVDRALLDQSLRLGTDFLLASQLADGSFRYHVHFLTGETAPEQGAVRQAGALWGLALVHQQLPSAQTRAGVLRGLAFFREHSRCVEQRRFLEYPGTSQGDTGAVALVTLALIDFLRVESASAHGELRQQQREYVNFLVSLRRSDDCFYSRYLLGSGEGWGSSSAYFDGEVLLALVKAARYAGQDELRSTCLSAAEAMYQKHVARSLALGLDAPETKGFYQWGAMAFQELVEAGWEGSEPFARRVLAMTDWMIDVHRVLERRRNTAYALEGIASAYAVADRLQDRSAAAKLRRTAEAMLLRLTAWQVGGPMPSAYLRQHQRYELSCRGGILGAEEHPWLRIDTTQHQMHAVILCRRYLWP